MVVAHFTQYQLCVVVCSFGHFTQHQLLLLCFCFVFCLFFDHFTKYQLLWVHFRSPHALQFPSSHHWHRKLQIQANKVHTTSRRQHRHRYTHSKHYERKNSISASATNEQEKGRAVSLCVRLFGVSGVKILKSKMDAKVSTLTSSSESQTHKAIRELDAESECPPAINPENTIINWRVCSVSSRIPRHVAE